MYNPSTRRWHRVRSKLVEIKWTNRIEIVDGYLRLKDLSNARIFSKEILAHPEAMEMLTENEIEYLKLVISLETLEEITRKGKK